MQITAKSYFSGAGGMDLGIEEAGINILESYEIELYRQKIIIFIKKVEKKSMGVYVKIVEPNLFFRSMRAVYQDV